MKRKKKDKARIISSHEVILANELNNESDETIEEPWEDIIRWDVVARYRKEGSDLAQLRWRLKDLWELHALIEEGPNYHTVEEIIIRKVPFPGLEEMTLKEAKERFTSA